jgi:hypothetical protein
MRFLLFAGVAWLLFGIIRLVLRSISQSSAKQKPSRKYGIGKQKPEATQVEFKDVQDAEFVDVTEKEKVSK